MAKPLTPLHVSAIKQAITIAPGLKKLASWKLWLREKRPALYNLLDYTEPMRGYADTIHLDAKVDPYTIRTTDGSFIRTWRYVGADRSNDDIDIRARLNARVNDVFNDLDDGWTVNINLDRYPASDYPDADYPNRASWLVGEERRQEFRQHRFYESETYISLTYRAAQTSLKRKRATSFVDDTTAEALDMSFATFTQKCDAFIQSFGAIFDLEPLGLRETEVAGERVVVDDQLRVMHRLITGRRQDVLAISNFLNIADYLTTDTVIHRDAVVRIGSMLLRPVTVIDFPNWTTPTILDVLDQFAGELLASWRWISEDRDRATTRIKHVRGMSGQRKQSILKSVGVPTNQDEMPDYDAADMQHDAELAMRHNANKSVRYGYFTLTVTPLVMIAEGEDESVARTRLDALAAQIIGALRARYFLLSENLGNEVEAVRGMIPGQNLDNVVKPMLGSRNLADFVPTTHVWSGPKAYDDNDEFFPGQPPMLVLYSQGRTPFRFVHSRAGRGGNMLLLGDPRSGKSTFAGLFANQYLQYARKLQTGAAVVVIDKGRSHYVQCRAVGGDFLELSPNTERGFALFSDLETRDGFNFALSILMTMLAENGGLPPNAKEALFSALHIFKATSIEDRTLTKFLHSGIDQSIGKKLAFYSRDQMGGALFEGTEPLSLHKDFTVIEIGPIEEQLALKKVALYATMHALSRLADGSRPIQLLGEEIWTLASNPETDAWFIKLLKDKPKQGLSCTLITHNLADLSKSSNPQSYIDSCGTKVLFPSESLRDAENITRLEKIGLTPAQIRAHAENTGRNVALIVQGNHVRTVAVPLGPVTRAIVGLSNERERNMAEQLMQSTPDDWLPELIYTIAGPAIGEGWRRHAYFWPPTPPAGPVTSAPSHGALHPNDPLSEDVQYAS